MKQRVKNICYLAKSVQPLSEFSPNTPRDLLFIPAGAEVIHIDVEVLAAGVGGTNLDIGLEGEQEFFANDLDVATKSYYNIARGTSAKSTTKITGTLNQASAQGEISVRVQYFLPSEYTYEV